MRVCDQQPMPKLDTTRYQLDAPPSHLQADLAAWRKSTDNAQAQLEHQGNRCAAHCVEEAGCLRAAHGPCPHFARRLVNLELLQKFGANAWRAHLDALEAANKRCGAQIIAGGARMGVPLPDGAGSQE